LKQSHKPKRKSINKDSITVATSPEQGAKQVQIRTTSEKMKEIQANISRGAQQEKDIGDQTLSENQHTWKHVYHDLMAPPRQALNHLAMDMLLKFSMKGCSIKIGMN
jgi:Zn/Cd-binding protein ZinT